MRIELSPGLTLEIFPPVRSSRRLWVARARLTREGGTEAAQIFSGIGATQALAVANAQSVARQRAGLDPPVRKTKR